ncbi:MAG TPA: lipid-transfer protein [Acidimicrobiia bacterium]|nr:lipid-transfer protein [Acidimicrobiia bacterium]
MIDDQLRGRACIVGIGRSAYGKRGTLAHEGTLRLALQAIHGACADAGLDPTEIDGFSSYSDDAAHPSMLQMALGTPRVRYAGMVWGGGGAGMGGALANAAMAVATGVAECVVVLRSISQGDLRFGRSLAGLQGNLPAPFGYALPFGLMSPAQMFALPARRHMHVYGTTVEHFAEVSVNARRNGATNPDAIFRTEITVEDHHASRMIADPLRLFDICMESDGAAAVILTTPERARDLRGAPVSVLGASVAGGYRWGEGMLSGHNMPEDDYASAGQQAAADEVYRQAGVGPDDVDVAMIYDHFTPLVLMGLEDFGFCKRGESGPFVADGTIRREGALPVNTHGGNLAEVYLHGMTHVLEAVRQLRGTSCNQVDGAEVALVVAGAGPTPSGAIVLSK